MLAKPTKAIGEVLNRFEGKEFTCEYKYDGERAQVSNPLRSHSRSCLDAGDTIPQIHRLENGELVVFSRNSENMSSKYPDLIESMSKVSVRRTPHKTRLEADIISASSPVYQRQRKVFRDRCRSRCLRHDNEEVATLPRSRSPQAQRCPHRRYYRSGSRLCFRSTLFEWRSELLSRDGTQAHV
jgi:hypothetical protein